MLRSRVSSGMQPRESKLWVICGAEAELCSPSQLFPSAISAPHLPAFSLAKYLFGSKGCAGANLESVRSPHRCGESSTNDVNWLQPS